MNYNNSELRNVSLRQQCILNYRYLVLFPPDPLLGISWKKKETGCNMTRKDGNVLFNDTLSTFYCMVIWHLTWLRTTQISDNESENPWAPLHGLLFLIISKESFYLHHPQTR